MKIEITRNGETAEVEIDLSLEDPGTLREQIRLEEALGADLYQKIMDGEDFQPTPRIIEALVWSKLAKVFPDVGREDFDLDFGELAVVLSEYQNGQVFTLPMQTADGEVTEAEIQREASGGKG